MHLPLRTFQKNWVLGVYKKWLQEVMRNFTIRPTWLRFPALSLTMERCHGFLDQRLRIIMWLHEAKQSFQDASMGQHSTKDNSVTSCSDSLSPLRPVHLSSLLSIISHICWYPVAFLQTLMKRFWLPWLWPLPISDRAFDSYPGLPSFPSQSLFSFQVNSIPYIL